MQGKAILKSSIDEIARAEIALEPPAARAYVVTHVGLWSTAIKLNPS